MRTIGISFELRINVLSLEKLIYSPKQRPHRDVPDVVMASIPSYRGPIQWNIKDNAYSRIAFWFGIRY